MWIFSVYIFSAGFAKLFSHLIHPNYQRNFCIILGGLMLFCIPAFRHYSIGVDTQDYVYSFFQIQLYDFGSIFAEKSIEPGYTLLVKIISLLSGEYPVYLAAIALIYTISICVFVYRYSKEPCLSFILLLSLGFLYFSMAGLRQTVAMSILLFAYKYVRERKLLPFLFLVLLAYQFHNTAVIFLLSYPMAALKVNWKQFLLVGGALAVSTYFSSYVSSFLFEVLKWERISGYGVYQASISLSGFFIQFCIMIFCMVYYKNVITLNPQDLSLYNLMFIGLAFQAFTPTIGEFFRISMYFSIFNIALIPNVLMSEENPKTKVSFYFIIISLLLIYYYLFSGPIESICPYRFFWD